VKATPLGAVLAQVLSIGTRGLGLFLWYLLRVIYRGEARAMVPFAIGAVVIAGLLWWIF
jgi:hypothetical protein